MLRETAAFVAEELLLTYCHLNTERLFMPLHAAWQTDNTIYVGSDVVFLKSAMNTRESKYTYRMNYPIPRILANVIAGSGLHSDLALLFEGRLTLPKLLDSLHTEVRPLKMNNYLPEVPDLDTKLPAVNAYRRLGMMALLDIDYWQGESEKKISEYYSTRLTHMRDQTILVAIGKNQKPIGYALWQEDDVVPAKIHIKRQAAPFGDHLELHKALQSKLPENADVLSHHTRSARGEQIAW
jgi:hypothetical protein